MRGTFGVSLPRGAGRAIGSHRKPRMENRDPTHPHEQALRSMTSRGFTIAIVFVAVALAIGMGRAPCGAAPAVAMQSIEMAVRADARRAMSGSDFFSIPCLGPPVQ
jgi:hypothetical protein